jgi:hypothetical protein
MRKITRWLPLLVVLGTTLATGPARALEVEVEFCQFPLPEAVKKSNWSFHVIYAFEVDERGVPTAITKVRDRLVGEEQVSACLERWRIRGFEEPTQLSASFRWEHGKGWVTLTVAGPGMSYTTHISGERAPYGGRREEADRDGG